MSKQRAPVTIDAPVSEESRGISVLGGVEKMANGGLDGASHLNRDTALWYAPDYSADESIRRAKPTADLRSRDQLNNNGYMAGYADIYKDSVVGAKYELNLKPKFKYLRLDEGWAAEYKSYFEELWGLYAESDECYVDATRRMNATEIIRLNIGVLCGTGEFVVNSEWFDKDKTRPYKTAFRTVDPNRLCNPNDAMDSQLLRQGISLDSDGVPIGYNFRTTYKNSPYPGAGNNKWSFVPARKPWGRKLVFHYAAANRPEQQRAVSRMVAVMKEMRMTEKFQDIVLQNAIVNATYAAAIESELPRDMVMAQLGEMGSTPSGAPLGSGPLIEFVNSYLANIAEFTKNGKNLALDGVKIPHLYPGTKLNLQPAGNPGGVGTGFENSFLRHISRSLGISYEEFSGNFGDSNYSSARAAMLTTERSVRATKRMAADRLANSMFSNFAEEEINRKGSRVPMPANAPNFYEGMNRAAYVNAEWVGSARGQIDEVKETQAAGMRIGLGLSTIEKETARLGGNWVENANQRKREKEVYDELGLPMPQTQTSTKDSFGNNNQDPNNDPKNQ